MMGLLTLMGDKKPERVLYFLLVGGRIKLGFYVYFRLRTKVIFILSKPKSRFISSTLNLLSSCHS